MVTVTPEAAKRLKNILDKKYPNNPEAGVRFSLKAGGCSGFTYEPLTAEPKPEQKYDEVFESNGVKIFVFKRLLPLVDGTEIDYSNKLLHRDFVFNNPKAKASCGCGQSFELK